MIDQFSTLRLVSILVGVLCGCGVYFLAGLLERHLVTIPTWCKIVPLFLIAPAICVYFQYSLRRNHQRLVELPRNERGHDVSHAFNAQLMHDAAVFMGFCAVACFMGGLIAILWFVLSKMRL
jgi:hypothetical protein